MSKRRPLTDEEKRLRDSERRKAAYKYMKENEPKKYAEFKLNNNEAFRNWYDSSRNPDTNEYVGRERVLADKQKNLVRNKLKEAEYRKKNKLFLAFVQKSRTGGRYCTKRMWDSWHELSQSERNELLEQYPHLPSVVRPEGLVLRRKINAPDRTTRGELIEE